MCKMARTPARKTYEILTDLAESAWPYDADSCCTPTSPCPHLARLIKRNEPHLKHEERLEFDTATESAAYPEALNKELTAAIFAHHNITIPQQKKRKRSRLAKRRTPS